MIALTLLVTAVLGFFGAGLKVVIDPATLAPQGHPYIQATNRVDAVFGLTRQLERTPGVVRSTLVSLASRQ